MSGTTDVHCNGSCIDVKADLVGLSVRYEHGIFQSQFRVKPAK